jgi:hypothetical protein
MRGNGANGQTWMTTGTLTDDANDLLGVIHSMMIDSFAQLTKGKAQFGKPGEGCSGPYEIERIVIEKKT